MGLTSTLRVAWRNLGRNRRRTALALSAIAVAELVLVVFEGLMTGYADSMVQTVTGPIVGHAQVHAPKWREDRALDRSLDQVQARVDALQAVPGVAHVNARVFAPILAAKDQDGQAVVLVGVDFDAERRRGLLDGVTLARPPGPRQVVLGTVAADVLKAKVGDTLALVGQAADGAVASGLYVVADVVATQVDLVNRQGLLMRLDDARELLALPDGAHELSVVGTDLAVGEGLAERLAREPALQGTEVLSWRKLAPEFASFISFMWAYESIILVLVFVAAAAGAANTMMMATFERTRELGMLLALGCKPRRIIGLVVTEATLLGLVGLAVGGLLGVAVVLVTSRTGVDLSVLTGQSGQAISFIGMRSSMEVFPKLDLAGLGRSLAAVLVTSLLAALWPAIRAARLQPVEAMRA